MKIRKPRLYIPKKLKVDNVVYKIQRCKSIRDEDSKEDRYVLGQVEYDKALIQIDKTKDPDSIIITLIHELTHAIFHERGIDELIKSEEKYERVVDEVAKGYVQVLRDNPEIYKFIIQRIKKDG